jgi:hypothetical protein
MICGSHCSCPPRGGGLERSAELEVAAMPAGEHAILSELERRLSNELIRSWPNYRSPQKILPSKKLASHLFAKMAAVKTVA